MLIGRSPGGGICYVGSINTKPKAKSADNFKRNRGCVQVSSCPYFPVVDGGNPTSLPSYIIDGGSPTSVGICFIDGGLI
jgi:hypothetical protein